MTNLEFNVDAFNFWRYDRTASMTLVDLCYDGALYYYKSPYNCSVWVFSSNDAMLISYGFKGTSPGDVRIEVKRLLDALRNDPGTFNQGHYPVLATLYNASEDKVDVACFHPGDWWGLTRSDLPPRWDQLPPGWAESERDRIATLVDERVKLVLASNLQGEISPVGYALMELKLFDLAEPVFGRILVLEKQAGNARNVASVTQTLGVIAAYQERYDDAATLLREAIQLRTTEYGEDDPRVKSVRETLERVTQKANSLI